MKELLFSVTAKDCDWTYYRGTGKGGQKRNKTSNCARCKHRESGAIGKSERGRSKERNRRNAFLHMIETDRFKAWHKLEIARRTGETKNISDRISIPRSDLKIEVIMDGKWVELQE